MKQVNVDNKAQFLDMLDEAFNQKLSAQQARRLSEFARLYLENLPLEEVNGRRLSDIYGAVISSWHFVQQRAKDEFKVAVFNPELEAHGWQSTHTVLGVLHQNVPFIMDSIRMCLNRLNFDIHSIQHAVLYIRRDKNGRFKELLQRSGHPDRSLAESTVYIEIDRHNDPQVLSTIRDEISTVLRHVSTAVADYEPMREHAQVLAASLREGRPGQSHEATNEAADFMGWLIADHFTFLGYDEYEFDRSKKEVMVRQVPGSALGIMKQYDERPTDTPFKKLPLKTRQHLLKPELLIFARSSRRSRIHRPAYPDYIAVQRFNEQGEVVGEQRFLGLFTSAVYRDRPQDIPVVRKKVEYVMERSGFYARDYAGKELDQILSVYPRGEMLQVDREVLFRNAMSILYIQERRKIRLFIREGVYGEFVTALVYVPRDVYNTTLRIQMSDILVEATNAEDVEFITYFSESVLARVQFILRVSPLEVRHLDCEELEAKIIAAAQSWQDGLAESLIESNGEERGNSLYHNYADGFSAAYQEAFSPRRAVPDIDHMESITAERPIAMSFYRAIEEPESTVHFKLFHAASQVPLSDVLPMFENLGLKVLGEHPFEVTSRDGDDFWIHDFALQNPLGDPIHIQKIRDNFETLFTRIWSNEAENDLFNRLALVALLDWRQIAMFRSYSRYMRQIRFGYSQNFIASTLVNHTGITSLIWELFTTRFDPFSDQSDVQRGASEERIVLDINQALEGVENLTEDRVLRRFVELIQATVRTNYFQTEGGEPKQYISLKMSPAAISEMPLPLPMFEIFVYSPRVEGVHLRGGKVARGGLRWSDRFEDYRTEVLGLVKAQQVKNSVIVPVGAKGGFVAKRLPDGDREAMQKEGIACYKTFIRGLLDLTDNLVEGNKVPPPDLVRHDPEDHYLVVAADKGTATFSDIANAIAADYNFWLGDAFASGGSQGYDHKKMGITAKGAWVSVERHFRELGLNTATEDFSVIGIGDMSGDVFGNGMLLSKHIRMLAAFNHLHIFVDPDPDPVLSFEERSRLFNLPRSNWTDYNSKLISKGGGVFLRSAKSIPISDEMKRAFDIKQDRLPPNMLISALLKAKADLLWIGGIGTYVKSSAETHIDVGDKANDGLRIDGRELRVRVIGEGGNLGMTHLGRVQYAATGGKCNTDFIDNAGGVDCSDHEVNIKILLNGIVQAGDMTPKQRNTLLAQMTDEVAALVLMNNYRQTQALSIATHESAARVEEYRRLMNYLESIGKLNRQIEFMPDDEAIRERKSENRGLFRPELCTLISYVKGHLKEVLSASDMLDDEYYMAELQSEFPASLVRKFEDQLWHHRLRKEIIATQVANDMVNLMGITFVDRLRQSTGATIPAIAQAYVISRDVFGLKQYWRAIEDLDNKVPADTQISMMLELIRLIRRSSRWFLRNRRAELKVLDNMERFSTGIGNISADFDSLLVDQQHKAFSRSKAVYEDVGVPSELAAIASGASHLYSCLGIIEAQSITEEPLETVARMFFAIGSSLDLIWFNRQINEAKPATHWQALARESFREDLDWQQRSLTVGILKTTDPERSIEQRIQQWAEKESDMVERWRLMLTELKATKDPEFPMYSVALRELLDLAQTTTHKIMPQECQL
ncbi:NAD-glutamate dehydrogenase GdhB [Allohahella marinimesophila]|uniref:NAD-glutamate dehydrogenase GdhB n=1 Tax=Allohahella marinimesophila TaxID=1054972 RepID=A0ABP7QDR9_9GAMM